MAKRSRRKRDGLGPPSRKVKPPPAAPKRRPLALGYAVVGLTAIGVVVAAIVLATGSTSTRSIAWAKVPDLQRGPAPWSSASGTLSERLAPAHLHALTMEGAVVHIHQHLDLFVNGRKIPVPAFIGIGPGGTFLTEIHTHDASGIVHVESPTKTPFTLGQMFCEWGVKLTRTCLGRYRGRISWWVDGKKMSGDPAQLVLAPHQEIAIAAGRAPAHVPVGFTFPPGY
jgi:hypothetical protein